jgi:hypothetical protein
MPALPASTSVAADWIFEAIENHKRACTAFVAVNDGHCEFDRRLPFDRSRTTITA